MLIGAANAQQPIVLDCPSQVAVFSGGCSCISIRWGPISSTGGPGTAGTKLARQRGRGGSTTEDAAADVAWIRVCTSYASYTAVPYSCKYYCKDLTLLEISYR